MNERTTKLTTKIILVISGSCDGPIDQIFGWRDKTGCGGFNYFNFQTEGEARELGVIASIFLLLFIALYYVLYKLWIHSYKRK